MTAVPDAKALRSAAFLLAAANSLNIKVGTDGTELVMLVPVKVPWETQKWFSTKLYEFKAEVIATILQENTARARTEAV
jgi:hypothetical protein